MTHVSDLVQETTQTMGVGACTLLGAVPGFFSFAEAFADGDEVFYCRRQDGGAREVCKGVFTAPATLSRGTVLRSSVPGNAPVNWGDGVCVVYCCLPAGQVLLAENALSEIADFLIADNALSEIAALGTVAKDAALGNLGATTLGKALIKAANAAAARASLNLGTAAQLDWGTGPANALALDGAGKIPAVPGDQLTSLPFHTHSAVVGPYTGGASGKVLRYSSSGVLTAASMNDTPDLLAHVMLRGTDGTLYGRGSLRVPMTGLVVAGQRYWLSTAGDLRSTPPTPQSPASVVTQLELGQCIETGFLYFDPLMSISGVNGFSAEIGPLYLEGGTLRVR